LVQRDIILASSGNGTSDMADRSIGGKFPVRGSRPDTENAYREMNCLIAWSLMDVILASPFSQVKLYRNVQYFGALKGRGLSERGHGN
jgi:hypothetical protein